MPAPLASDAPDADDSREAVAVDGDGGIDGRDPADGTSNADDGADSSGEALAIVGAQAFVPSADGHTAVDVSPPVLVSSSIDSILVASSSGNDGVSSVRVQARGRHGRTGLTPLATATMPLPSATASPTSTPGSVAATEIADASAHRTATARAQLPKNESITPINTMTPTPTNTVAATSTSTSTATSIPAATATRTPTPTSAPAATATRTPTAAPVPTATPQAGTLNTLNTVISDMQGSHEGCLPTGTNGVDGYSWQFSPETDAVSPPSGYAAETGWGAVEADCGGNPVSNVRVQFRGFKTYVLLRSTNRWTLIASPGAVDGAQFLPNFAGNVNDVADIRPETGGSSVKPVAGRAFHFWGAPNGRVNINGSDVAAIFVTMQSRLILDNAGGPDNIDSAKLMLAMGGDWWLNLSAPWPNNEQAGFGKFKWLTRNWRAFNLTTASAATLQSNPPPLD